MALNIVTLLSNLEMQKSIVVGYSTLILQLSSTPSLIISTASTTTLSNAKIIETNNAIMLGVINSFQNISFSQNDSDFNMTSSIIAINTTNTILKNNATQLMASTISKYREFQSYIVDSGNIVNQTMNASTLVANLQISSNNIAISTSVGTYKNGLPPISTSIGSIKPSFIEFQTLLGKTISTCVALSKI